MTKKSHLEILVWKNRIIWEICLEKSKFWKICLENWELFSPDPQPPRFQTRLMPLISSSHEQYTHL